MTTPEDHRHHYLALPTEAMRSLRDTLIEGRGNPDLLSALTEELARRDAPAPAPTGPHLVDAAAPAMRKLLARVADGMWSAGDALDVLLDWPNRAAGSVSTTPTQPTWPGTHDEDDSLVARLDRALSLTGPHDRPSVGDLTIAQEHIRRVRQAIDEGGIRCRRGHYTAHDDVIGDPNSPRWKCSHCVRVGVDAQTIVDGMTGVSTTPDPAAVDIVWDHRALAYAVKVLVPGAPALLTHARYWDEPEANAAADRVRAALAGNTKTKDGDHA